MKIPFPTPAIPHDGLVQADEISRMHGRSATAFLASHGIAMDGQIDDANGRLPEPETAADDSSAVAAKVGQDSSVVTHEAAESFIESKRIGDRIKFLRQRKNMGLVELGRHTGLSASFLSQLETGRVVPTLRNLARIAMVFSKDLGYFFEPERPEFFRILRAGERQRLPQTGADEPGYFFESLGQMPLDGGVVPYVAEFLPASDRRPGKSHGHAGAEFLYVLSGCLRLTHDGRPEELIEGDAVFFHSTPPHSYERVGENPCTALILTMHEPPRGHHPGSCIPMRSAKATNGTQKRRR